MQVIQNILNQMQLVDFNTVQYPPSLTKLEASMHKSETIWYFATISPNNPDEVLACIRKRYNELFLKK
jgi:hypothetical protein